MRPASGIVTRNKVMRTFRNGYLVSNCDISSVFSFLSAFILHFLLASTLVYLTHSSTLIQWREGELESIGFLFSFSIYAIVWQRVFSKIIVDCSCQGKSYDFLSFEFEYAR